MASKEYPVAVIGIACRIPECKNASQFWKFIEEKKQSIAEFPSNRAKDIEHVLSKIDPSNLSNPEKPFFPGSYFESIDKFDAQFFGISGQEVQAMDPQHRFFLETAWEAIEDAGIASSIYGSETGVYTGDTTNKYSRVLTETNTNVVFGTLPQMIPSRLSYTLDLKGPTMVVGVGCSSSLLAVHLACQGLRSGDCKLAIAGGVTIDCTPINEKFDIWNLVNLLNTEEEIHCCPFDSKAKGYVKGEGCSIVVLKPLSEAVKDGNHIYGVIAGSAANQKSRGNGLSTPNPKALCDVTLEAWRRADVKAKDIDYFEASGTSKSSVDAIEITAIQMAFDSLKGKNINARNEKPCLGAVTGNVCHLVEGAAGVTGLIKVLLSLENETIPPQNNFIDPNPMINWKKCPLRVNTEKVDWKAREGKSRIGSISSFGTSGTNVHLVVRDFKPDAKRNESDNDETSLPILITAGTQSSLKCFIEKLRDYLLKNKASRNNHFFKDLAYTLNVGRDHKRLNFKSLIFAKNTNQFIEKLEKLSQYLESHELKPITAEAFNEITDPKSFISFSLDPKGKWTEVDLQKLENIDSVWFPLIRSILNRESIKWTLFEKQNRSHLPLLPTYSFEEQRFWPKIMHSISASDTVYSSSVRSEYVIISEENTSDESIASHENSRLFECWVEVLNIRPTNDSHFFHCGGNSMKALHFISKLRDELELDIRLSHVYQYPKYEDLREVLKSLSPLKNMALISSKDVIEEESNMSNMQKSVVMLQQMSPSSTAYTECVSIFGHFEDVDSEKIMKKVLDKFAYLTSFFEENESGDKYLSKLSVDEVIRSSILDTVFVATKDCAVRAAKKLRPNFEVKTGASLVKLLTIEITNDCEANKMIVLYVHYTLVDDVSLSYIENYVLQLMTNDNIQQPEVFNDFDNFCLTEKQYLKSESLQRDLESISCSFETAPQNVSIGFSPEIWSESKTYDCSSKYLEINLNLEDICDNLTIRPFHYFLSCYLLTLKRYTSENDLMTGVTISTRSHTFQSSFGPFINTVLYRYEIENETDLETYIQTVTSKWLQVQDTSMAPLANVLSYLRDERSITDISLSNVFNYSETKKLQSSVYIPPLHTKVPFSVFVRLQSKTQFSITIEWSSSIVHSDIANNFGQSFVNVCKRIANNFATMRHERVSNIDVMSQMEHSTIIGFNRPLECTPSLVHRYFEKHCRSNGKRIAINSGDKSVTYDQLNSMANTIAVFIQKTVKQCDLQTKPIVLMMERNELLFATILGVWKAGGFILNISEDTQQRLLQIAEGVEFDLLITNLTSGQILVEIPQKISVKNVKDIVYNKRWLALKFEDKMKQCCPKETFAYMFLTSGTTGKPKRCMITHEGYSVYIAAFAADTDLRSFDVNVLQMISISFDVFLGELALGLLCVCGTITVVPQSQRFIVESVTKLIVDHKVSSCLVTPRFLSSVFLQLPKHVLKQFRLVSACGEEFYQNLYEELQLKCEPETKVVNAYGLTESTILSTIFAGPSNYLSSSAQIPIGKPMIGVGVYIVDPETKLLSPIGTIGELCISGAVVGKGDVKRTKFCFAGEEPVFMTGDGARWLPDGNVDFIGRKTTTYYKIRGYRVNPREIESVVLTKMGHKFEQLRVFVTEDFSKDQILCLVYKPKSGEKVHKVQIEIRNVIKLWFPHYMMPNIIKPIDNIPITSNGKTDLNLLRKACIGDEQNLKIDKSIDTELSEMESILVKHLMSMLPFSMPVDVNMNFQDQGIHSLQLMKFANRLLRENIPGFSGINDLFNYPNIKSLALKIDKNELTEDDISIKLSYDQVVTNLSEIWKSILSVDEVNEDDIFQEIGGDDSLTIAMMLKVREEMDVELELGHCYAYPSLKELAVHLKTLLDESSDTESNSEERSMDTITYNEKCLSSGLQTVIQIGNLLMFCGQGAQKETMFTTLIDDPVAIKVFEEARQITGIDILQDCKKKEKLQRTEFVQIALFVGCIAKLRQIQREKPHLLKDVTAVAGLSVGEFAALVYAGVLTFPDALRLVYCRGKAMQKAVNRMFTGMVNILGPNTDQLSSFIERSFPNLYISGYLADNQHTVSGDESTIDEFVLRLSHKITADELNITDVRKLRVAGAFHTNFMKNAAFEVDPIINSISFNSPKIPVILNVNGKSTTDPETIRSGLKLQLVTAVHWKQIIETAVEMGIRHFLELSPSPILTPLIRKRIQLCIDSKCTAEFISI